MRIFNLFAAAFCIAVLPFMAQAQNPPDVQSYGAELIVLNSDQSEVGVDMKVTSCGFLFNEIGESAAFSTPQTGTKELVGFDDPQVTISIDPGDALLGESILPGDGEASLPSLYLGWGVYRIKIIEQRHNGWTRNIYINTIDGNWCHPDNYDPENGIFRDAFVIKVQAFQDYNTPPVITWYDWVNQTYVELDDGEEIGSWRLRDDVNDTRNRDGLTWDPAGTQLFDIASSVPLIETHALAERGFAVLDFNVNLNTRIKVPGNVTLKVVPYVSDIDATASPTTVTITSSRAGINPKSGASVEILGQSSGYTLGSAPTGINVFFNSGVPWRGIYKDDFGFVSNDPVRIVVKGAKLERGGIDLVDKRTTETEPYEVLVDSVWIAGAEYGIRAVGCRTSVSNSLIEYSEKAGIRLEGHEGKVDGTDYDVFKCTIQYNRHNGIEHIGDNTFQVTLNNSRGFVVDSSWILWNDQNGIFSDYGILTVYDGLIYANGMDGTFINHGISNIHRNKFYYNPRYGLYADNSTVVYGSVRNGTNGPTTRVLEGLNCFQENDISIGAMTTDDNAYPLTTVLLGKSTISSDGLGDYVGHHNWSLYPTAAHVKASGKSRIWAQADFYSTNNPAYFIEDPESFLDYDPYYWSDNILCWHLNGVVFGPAEETRLSVNANLVLEKTMEQAHDSANYYASELINCELSPEEAAIYAEALVESYLFNNNQDAYDQLEYFAMQPQNPCDFDSCPMQWVFSHYYLKVNMLTLPQHATQAIEVADSILQRNCENSVYDIVEANTAKSIVLFMSGDTTSAETIITNLWNSYSDEYYVAWLYNYITGDSTAFDYLPKQSKTTEKKPVLPSTVSLAQNYPNPFNPNTQITFGIPEDGEVRLTVYDLMGREVAILATGMHQAGEHIYTFNAANLSSGVYLYKLHFGNTVLAKQMVLTK